MSQISDCIDIFLQKQQPCSQDQPKLIISNNRDPIGQFLNEQVFIHHQNQILQISMVKEHSKTETLEYQLESFPQPETTTMGRQKSIFHNFQKHLITTIKKYITLDENNIEKSVDGQLVKQLWTAFKRTHNFNKRSLHIVFGVLQSCKISIQFKKLTEEYAQFIPIYNKYQNEAIIAAQSFLRRQAINQISLLSRQMLESGCQVNRFDEFYEYFKSFVAQLSLGPMSKRMTKSRKHVVVQKLASQVKN